MLILYIVTVSDQGTWCADVLFFLCVYCIGVWGGLKTVGSKIAWRGEGASSMQMGQSGYSTGLEWTWIHSCASKATITCKGFIHKIKVNPHTLICCALKLTLCILLHCRPNVRLFSGMSAQLWTIMYDYDISIQTLVCRKMGLAWNFDMCFIYLFIY